MKKLLLTVILAAACQITFASRAFDHGRGEYRHHEHGCYRYHNCYRPLFYGGYFAGPRIWIGGQWIFSRRGRQIWIPGHWSY